MIDSWNSETTDGLHHTVVHVKDVMEPDQCQGILHVWLCFREDDVDLWDLFPRPDLGMEQRL
jgi:hypothetical protein